MRDARLRKVPSHLKHKPIFVVNEYQKIDADHKNNTDVIGLSIGKAQWCSDNFEPSVKVWRDVENADGHFRISRESEETTLTRALDMANLVLKIFKNVTTNENNTCFTNTVFDILNIEEYDTKLKNYLITYINNNKEVILSHINLLIETVNNFKNK